MMQSTSRSPRGGRRPPAGQVGGRRARLRRILTRSLGMADMLSEGSSTSSRRGSPSGTVTNRPHGGTVPTSERIEGRKSPPSTLSGWTDRHVDAGSLWRAGSSAPARAGHALRPPRPDRARRARLPALARGAHPRAARGTAAPHEHAGAYRVAHGARRPGCASTEEDRRATLDDESRAGFAICAPAGPSTTRPSSACTRCSCAQPVSRSPAAGRPAAPPRRRAGRDRARGGRRRAAAVLARLDDYRGASRFTTWATSSRSTRPR